MDRREAEHNVDVTIAQDISRDEFMLQLSALWRLSGFSVDCVMI